MTRLQKYKSASRKIDRMTDEELAVCYFDTGDGWAWGELCRRRHTNLFTSAVKHLAPHGMEHGAAYVTYRAMEEFRRSVKLTATVDHALQTWVWRLSQQYLQQREARP